ncbi:MAG: hypothetical protein JNL47_03785, partial [Bacteroidia bacterium]|nr:hypothetical protein [Bacteroidia bacterium]
ITADNLIFPSYYTFKTIRGVYPTEAEVMADYTPENGCQNISDLRQVPVRTDLRTDVAGFPNNPAVVDHSVFASIYYLEPGSKLTLLFLLTVWLRAFICSGTGMEWTMKLKKRYFNNLALQSLT